MTLSRSRIVVASLVAASFALSLHAQRQHVNGLIGEDPDVSNWPHPAAPDGNPYPRSTANPADIAKRDEIAQLGKALFWDEQVSSDNTMACGTCHIVADGGSDGRLGATHANGNFGAFGVIPQAVSGFGSVDYGFLNPASAQIDRLITPVAPPTMIGAYVFNQLFWDMRAGPQFLDDAGIPFPDFLDWAALEALAVGPPVSDVEMGHQGLQWAQGFIQKKLGTSMPLAMVDPGTIPPDIQWVPGIGAPYHKVFDIVFGSHPVFGGGGGVTRERFALAVAHYHRTLIPDQAPIDRGSMTQNQIDGFEIFRRRSGCVSCHSATGNPTLNGNGMLDDPFDNPLSDGQSHGIGLPGQPRRKTPTLRNIGLFKKFFSTGHGGDGNTQVFVTNMTELVEFYNRQSGRTGFDGQLTQAEKDALQDFLENGLTDPRVASEQAPFDRPRLYSETAPFEANEYGVGTPSFVGGPVPEIIANSPPLVVHAGASQWFKLGVGNADANTQAFLLVAGAPAGGPQIWVASPFTVITANPTNAQGIATIHMPFPLTTSVIGVPFFVQWMLRGGRYGRSFSDAAVITPFQF